ncbi:MAG: UDP-2,3-diacylglucosamine diphosphatase LpxI [Aquificaceae bacterium]|nr:UDP-2,3-diacylglucosamine diphosphatase LpxI [Aquificaceae bacterium]MCX8059884.1 UDP-2,3-diacylglucosamine diphosphatase LpxI [Aquificaceae bacterium]MDW8096544.1 UDP-2,3-diacylglucosamine diphosphatase LpxI [Aquificaceae bacterium]
MKLCLLAGAGELPKVFLRKAKEKGVEVFVAGVKGVTDVPADEYFPLGNLERLLKSLEKRSIDQIVMLGKFEPSLLFSHLLTLDRLALRILQKAKDRRPQTLVKTLMQELESVGYQFPDPRPFLEELLAPAGEISPFKPSPQAMEDGLWGFPLAKEIATLDIGQTLVVKEKTVLSVEAMEGTQKAIERVGKLAGKGCRVIKTARKSQDFRVDVPTVGPKTLEAIRKVGGDALFVEAGKVYILEKEKMKELSKKYCIALYGL